jgi:hypothetical protein
MKTLHLFSVKLLRPSPEDPSRKELREEFYVASSILDVWHAMRYEIVEAESITRQVQITGVLFHSPGSERLPKTDRRPPIGMWACGEYICQCVDCGAFFLGDKRAGNCADCAYQREDRMKSLPLADDKIAD